MCVRERCARVKVRVWCRVLSFISLYLTFVRGGKGSFPFTGYSPSVWAEKDLRLPLMKEKIWRHAACWVPGSPLTLPSSLPSQDRLPRECVPSFLKQIHSLNLGPSSTLVANQWVSEICLSPNQCLECRGYKWALMCLDLTWVPGNRTQVFMLSKQPLYTKWAPFALPNFS